jgi:hypothetical protein
MSGLSFFGKFLKTNKYGLNKIKQFNQVISWKRKEIYWNILEILKI